MRLRLGYYLGHYFYRILSCGQIQFEGGQAYTPPVLCSIQVSRR